MKANNLLFSLLCCLHFCFTNSLPAQTDFTFNLLWEQNVFPNNPYTIEFDKLDRPYFYIANDNGGVRIFKKGNNEDPVQIDQVMTNNWENLKVMDLFQQDNYLYLALGSFFDNGEDRFGIAIINVTEPEAAIVTDFWISGNGKKGAALIRVEDNFAFLGAMNDGLYIFDISNPDSIVAVSNYLPNPDFPVPNPSSVAEPNARGLAIKDNLVYQCYDAGGLSVIDISNINNPVEIHRYINEDFLNLTQQAYNDIVVNGDRAYVSTDFCGLEILDISNPLDISQLGIWNPWNCETTANNWLNSEGHANQLGFLPGYEGALLILNANDTELVALDVSNPAGIQLVGTYGETGDNIRTWGLGISEDYIAAAYYFTILPWASTESKVKLFGWEIITATSQQYVHKMPVLYPNPVSDNLIIDLNQSKTEEITVRIYDLTGRQIFDKKHTGFDQNIIEISTLSLNLTGLHIVQLETTNWVRTHKILFN